MSARTESKWEFNDLGVCQLSVFFERYPFQSAPWLTRRIV
jgi:hypothetical protein